MVNIITKCLDINDFFINNKLEKIAEISENLSENAKTTDISTNDISNINYAVILKTDDGEAYPKYAMHTSGITELNLAFLCSQINELPEELVKIAATNLNVAANKYNLEIPQELSKYSSNKFINRELLISNINEYNFLNKSAKKMDNKKYALKNVCPISNKEEIIKSAEWFNKNYIKLDIDEQQEFVQNITKQANLLNVQMDGLLSDFSNLDENSFNPEFNHHINIRKSYVTDGAADDVFTDLLNQKNEIGPYKVAYVLEIIDKEYNLNNLYGDKILDPMRTSLGSIKKEASINFRGVNVTQSILNDLPKQDLAYIVGEGVITDLRSDTGLQVFDTLPYPMKQEIIGLIND